MMARELVMPRKMAPAAGGDTFRYFVYRHGGRGSDVWRMVFRSTSYDLAIAKYEAVRSAMRQGAVRLDDYREDVIMRQDSAPRLRTRW